MGTMRGAPNLVLVMALVTTSCANTNAMRGLAGKTSIKLTDDSTQLSRFVATARQSALDRAATLAALQAASATDQAAATMEKNAWTLAARKDLLDLTTQIQKVQPADILAALPVAPTVTAALDDGGAGAALDKAAATYATMAKKPRFKQRVQEIFTTGQAVEDATKAIQAKAATGS